MRKIIRELEASLTPLHSPMAFESGPNGFVNWYMKEIVKAGD